jgi:hypothetical protein
MNLPHKLFLTVFLLLQTLVVFKACPQLISYNSYTAEVLSQVFFSVSKVNRMYNFFTNITGEEEYTYTSNYIFMLKQQDNKVDTLPITQKGSIKHLVHPINAARVSHLQALALSDTLLYNAVVRSEAVYFFEAHPTYPIIYFEVLNHRCRVKKIANQFIKEEKIDTVYHNYFTMNE